jgi:hypothetical protein
MGKEAQQINSERYRQRYSVNQRANLTTFQRPILTRISS